MAERVEKAVYSVHWSAILAGSFVALGVWVFLYALGASIGSISALRRGAGTWTAIYTLVSPIIALFIGGLIVARSRDIVDKADGALHATVVWGFCTILGGLLLGTLGVLALMGTQAQANLPSGYMWAVTGSILGSLVAAILGASTVSKQRRFTPEQREVTAPGTRREVYP